jgi:uncharacterized protein DUF1707
MHSGRPASPSYFHEQFGFLPSEGQKTELLFVWCPEGARLMEPSGGVRASDADRDAAAGALADAVAAGRLSLPEHNARLDALFAAVTEDQVSAVIADLPARPVSRSALYRAVDPYRCVVIGGSAQRVGRFQIGRFCTVTAVFGSFDLDLRAAQPSQDEITLSVWSVAARVAVTVPARWRVTDQVLVLGTRRAIADGGGDAGAPLLRLRGTCLGGSFQLTQD